MWGYVMGPIETQGGVFSCVFSLDSLALIFTFAGFNYPDFHIRWIQLVVDFFWFVCCCYVSLVVAAQLRDVEVFD